MTEEKKKISKAVGCGIGALVMFFVMGLCGFLIYQFGLFGMIQNLINPASAGTGPGANETELLPPSQLITMTPSLTIEQTPTVTLTPTLEISLTPSLTLTPTIGNVLVSVSEPTFCRKGPGSGYDVIAIFDVGEQSEVFAKDPLNSSWYVRNPKNPSSYCWIYGGPAFIVGDPAPLPVYTPLPTSTPTKTPTPSPDFVVTYTGPSYCAGYGNYVKFSITNNGGVTWQSYMTSVTDTVTMTTVNYTSDQFNEYNGCMAGTAQKDLTPGESGQAHSDYFMVDPMGHALTATIKVCTQDSLGGLCITKTLNFTP